MEDLARAPDLSLSTAYPFRSRLQCPLKIGMQQLKKRREGAKNKGEFQPRSMLKGLMSLWHVISFHVLLFRCNFISPIAFDDMYTLHRGVMF